MSSAATAGGPAAPRRRARGLRWWWAPVGFVASHGVPTALLIGFLVAAGERHASPWVTLAATTLLQACMVLVAWWFARRAQPGRPWRTLVVCPANARHTVGWVLLGWVSTIVFSGIYWAAADPKLPRTHHTGLPHSPSTAVVAAVIVSAVVLAPIAEELFYRGFFFGALRRRQPVGWATAISSIVFGLAHWLVGGDPLVSVPPRIILGVICCLLVVRTGSLLPGMALHAWNNAVATAPGVTGLILVVVIGALAALVTFAAPWRLVTRPASP